MGDCFWYPSVETMRIFDNYMLAPRAMTAWHEDFIEHVPLVIQTPKMKSVAEPEPMDQLRWRACEFVFLSCVKI